MIDSGVSGSAGLPGGRRGTPRLLHDLRSLRVAVFHPEDRDGEELMLQLQRIGCKALASWPPRPALPEDVDLVFLAVDAKITVPEWALRRDWRSPPIVAVVTYENPTIMDALLKIGVEGIVTSPIKGFGLLATMVVARQINQHRCLLIKQNLRLDAKLSGVRQVVEAKSILMQARGISEEEAYRLMREQAMLKRVTIEHIASTIVEAHKLLPLNPA